MSSDDGMVSALLNEDMDEDTVKYLKLQKKKSYGIEQPVKLIKITKGFKLEVMPGALKVMRKVRGKLGVVAVIGGKGSGKSFMLNNVLGR